MSSPTTSSRTLPSEKHVSNQPMLPNAGPGDTFTPPHTPSARLPELLLNPFFSVAGKIPTLFLRYKQ